MSASIFWVCVALMLSFVVVQDANVVEWLFLQRKLLSVYFRRQWFMIRHNPESPWVKYEIKRNADKLARELTKNNNE